MRSRPPLPGARAPHARSSASDLPRALAALLVAALLVPHPLAADPGSIRILGVVTSDQGDVPLAGVDVGVEGARERAVTDTRGAFAVRVENAAAGEVTLTFSRLGFESASRTVAPTAEGVARIEVRLVPKVLALAPLAVLFERTRMLGDPATATGVPGSAFVLGSAELAASRMAFDNVHDLLRQVPGVNVQDEEGYGLRPHIGLRGAGAERSGNITLMEDGVLIAPAPYSAPAAYYFPAMGRMEGIEVRKGASQVRYGPRTLGGAVNLLSATIPERRSWRAEIGGGGDGTLRTHARAGDAGERHGWMLEGLQAQTRGFKEIQGGGSSGFDVRDVLGRFRVNTRRDARRYQELELKVGWNGHSSDETYLGLTEADFRATPNLRYAASRNDVMDTDHRQLQLRYFAQLTPFADVVVTGYRNAFARNWYKLNDVGGVSISAILADPDAHAPEMAILRGGDSADDALRLRANNRTYLSSGIQAVAGVRFGPEFLRHNLEAGVRLHADHEDRFQWDDRYRMEGGALVRTSEGVPGTQTNQLGEARAVAFFVQDEIRAGRLALVPGLRYEVVDFTRTRWAPTDGDRIGETTVAENRVSVLIPGIGATWEWTPRTHIFAGIHRGFGPPGPGADPETRPEEAVNAEAGIRVRGRALGANVTAFHSDYANILGRATLATGESGSGELFNGGEVRVLGLETAFDAELGRLLGLPLRVPARLSWTWTRGTFETDFSSAYGPWGTVERGDRLPYLPEHTWSGNLGVDDGVRSVTLSWNGASAMRTEAGSGPIAAGTGADRFTVLGLRGEWALPGGSAIYGGVQNLTDASHVVSRRPAGARPGLPRTLFAGFRIAR